MDHEERDYITLDDCFLSNTKLLERIIQIFDLKVTATLLGLCKDIPEVFSTLIQKEKAPELSLRNDSSTLTIFVRICFKYLFPLQDFKEDITFKHALRVDIHESIAMMIFHMERALYKHPKSHIIATTCILTLRGLCPKIIGVSVDIAKKIMKVAGMCSLSDKDLPDEIYIIIRDTSSGDLHICNKCKKWTCDRCEGELTKPKIPKLDLAKCKESISSPRNTHLHESSFSPRNIIHPRKRSLSKDPPQATSLHNIHSFLKKESPGNRLEKNYSLYDNFCRDVVYKGYRSVLLPSTPRKYHTFSENEIEELIKAWYCFMDTFENYKTYGDIIRSIGHNFGYKFSKEDFIYYDNLLSMEQRIKLYNEYKNGEENIDEEITKDEGIEEIWKRKIKTVEKMGSNIVFSSY